MKKLTNSSNHLSRGRQGGWGAKDLKFGRFACPVAFLVAGKTSPLTGVRVRDRGDLQGGGVAPQHLRLTLGLVPGEGG